MNATNSMMEGLWQMIKPLSYNNRKWLADKLLESVNANDEVSEKEQCISKKEILAGIDEALKEMKNGGGTDAWEFLKELRNESND